MKSTTNTPEMGKRVLEAFKARNPAHVCGLTGIEAAFEHDSWWILCKPCGASWGVHDAVGGDAVDGFGFEQIDEGEL